MRHAVVSLLLVLTLAAPTHAGRRCKKPELIYLTIKVVADGGRPKLAAQVAAHVEQQLWPQCFAPNVENTVAMRLTFRKGKRKPSVKLQNDAGLTDCFAKIDWSSFPAAKRKLVVKLAVTALDDY